MDISLNPNPLLTIEAEFHQAVQFHQSGRLEQAEAVYKKILDRYPNYPDALHLLGVIAHQQGKNEAAVELIAKAIAVNPVNPNYYNNMGASLRDMGRTEESLACYRKTVELKPDYAEAYNNMGNVLRDQGKTAEAIACYQKSLELKPDFMTAYHNLAIALKEQGELEKAVSCYQRALPFSPNLADTYNRMAHLLCDQGKSDEAAAYYRKSLDIQPNPGIEVKKALMIPAISKSKEEIVYHRKRVIEDIEALEKKGLRLEDPYQQVGTPNFYFAYHGLNDRDIQKRIAEFYIRICPELESDLSKPASHGDKIRLGIVSIHLYHPSQQTVGKLTHGIIKNLSREKFHITLFYFSGGDHRRTKAFEADEFVILPNHLKSAREKIAGQSLDIVFYPDIGMDGLTYFLAFSRLAPVQCVTWGHPVTTGIPNMDYFISSEFLEPQDADQHYSERLIRMKRLPVYYYRPVPPAKLISRKEFDLPEDCNLYVCPQAVFKFHPDFDAALGTILRRDPRGILVFLKGSYKHFTELIQERFKRTFPDALNRVRFISFVPHDYFLSLLMLADALIDPPYFGGGNTTYESFALGLPVVTWPGPFMRGRVTLGCYQQMGVSDCVAHDAQSYIEIALRLANDKVWQEEVSKKIRDNSHRLFEDMEAIQELERFFESAVKEADQHRKAKLHLSDEEIETEIRKAFQHHGSGQLQQAEAICEKVLEVNPNHAEALHLSGVIAHQSGKKSLAVTLINRAIQNNPQKACYYNSLGITFQDQGRTREAIACYQKALEIRPSFVEAYSNIGFALQDQGRHEEAIQYYQKALLINPNDASACNDMGTALQDLGRVDEAAACYQKALQIRPNYPEAYSNLGNAFKEQGKLDEAILCYKKALDLNPDYAKACCYLLRQLQQTCDWKTLPALSHKLDALTEKELERGEKTSESPFMNLARSMNLSHNLAVAKSWAKAVAKPMKQLNIHFSFEDRKIARRKITVGYISADFRNHAVSHLMRRVFGLHDRNDFNVFCYSYGVNDGSDYRKQIEQDCDRFVDIRPLSYADSAKRIYEDQVDILVELTGHTKDGRLEISALRPAPIQVIYLGFAGTSGSDFFDYIITDPIVTPPEHADYYTEKFAYMPDCFQVNDNMQPISDKQWKKADFGLPEDSFVFCSFNHGYKIEPVMFGVLWMSILRQVPKSILWLPKKSETGMKNLRKEAHDRGVDSGRLFFAERLPTKGEYLSRIRLADLVLDTRIYNGHTTTSDALWAGVPVITLQGSHYASRVASSILNAVGLPELVTHHIRDYERIAVQLANHPNELQALKMKLEQNRLNAPLFDTEGFVRNLEKIYKEMWGHFSGRRKTEIN